MSNHEMIYLFHVVKTVWDYRGISLGNHKNLQFSVALRIVAD